MILVGAEHEGMTTTAAPITLRSATAADADAIARLAALDSSHVPAGDLVVSEREGRIVAAVSVSALDAIADPFERTAVDVALLRSHATARREDRPARRHFRLVPRAV
jgi:hypothetical protein